MKMLNKKDREAAFERCVIGTGRDALGEYIMYFGRYGKTRDYSPRVVKHYHEWQQTDKKTDNNEGCKS